MYLELVKVPSITCKGVNDIFKSFQCSYDLVFVFVDLKVLGEGAARFVQTGLKWRAVLASPIFSVAYIFILWYIYIRSARVPFFPMRTWGW